MSHDRGCYCGRESYEYQDCPDVHCHKKVHAKTGLIYVSGNLVTAPSKVIVHGCNTQGAMGAGVAKAIREKWPSTFELYVQEVFRSELGDIIVHEMSEDKVIVHALTQSAYGHMGKYVSYDAVDKALKRLADWCVAHNIYEVAMPKIGAGLGGGDWQVVEAIVNSYLAKKVLVKVYDINL